MPRADTRLTRDRILATAEDVIRRFGPAKATVVDVARLLGVSHAAVYRHVATKAELRDLVVSRWAEETIPPLRAIASQPGSAPQRLRRLIDALIAVKRRRATEDPELFAAYRDKLLDSIYMGASDAPVDAAAKPPKPEAIGEFMKKAKVAPASQVTSNKAGKSESRKGDGVLGSTVESPASATPVYESYQADE